MAVEVYAWLAYGAKLAEPVPHHMVQNVQIDDIDDSLETLPYGNQWAGQVEDFLAVKASITQIAGHDVHDYACGLFKVDLSDKMMEYDVVLNNHATEEKGIKLTGPIGWYVISAVL